MRSVCGALCEASGFVVDNFWMKTVLFWDSNILGACSPEKCFSEFFSSPVTISVKYIQWTTHAKLIPASNSHKNVKRIASLTDVELLHFLYSCIPRDRPCAELRTNTIEYDHKYLHKLVRSPLLNLDLAMDY